MISMIGSIWNKLVYFLVGQCLYRVIQNKQNTEKLGLTLSRIHPVKQETGNHELEIFSK